MFRPLRWGLILGLVAGCSEHSALSLSADRSLVVILTPSGAFQSAEVIGSDAPTELELDEEAVVVAFDISDAFIRSPDGTRIADDELAALSKAAPTPEGSCNRCLVPNLSPTILHPGDRCPISSLIPGEVHQATGARVLESKADVYLQNARTAVELTRTGDCRYPSASLRSSPARPYEMCPLTPPGAPDAFTTQTILDDGTVVGAAVGYALVFPPETTVPRRFAITAGEIADIEPISDDTVMLLVRNRALPAVLETLNVQTGERATLDTPFENPGFISDVNADKMVIGGKYDLLPTAYECATTNLRCNEIQMPSQSTPGGFDPREASVVAATYAGDQIVLALENGPFIALAQNRVATYHRLDPLPESSLITDVVASQSVLVGIARASSENIVFRADLENGTVTQVEVVERLQSSPYCQSLLKVAGGFRVLCESSRLLDLDTTGRMTTVHALTGVGTDIWSEIPERPVRWVSAPSGQASLIQGQGTGLYRQSGTSRATPLWASEAPVVGEPILLTRNGASGACLAVWRDGAFRVSGPTDPRECSDLRAERVPPIGAGQAAVAFPTSQGFAVVTSTRGVVQVQHFDAEDQAEGAPIQLQGTAAPTVGAEVVPGRIVLGFASGRILELLPGGEERDVPIVADDPTTEEVEDLRPGSPLAVSSAGGVVWLSGIDTLIRVVPGRDGLVAESYWYRIVAAFEPDQDIAERRVPAISAGAPDRVWMVTTEETEHPIRGHLFYIRAGELLPKDGRITMERTDGFYGTVVNGAPLILAGSGPRVTFTNGRTFERTDGQYRLQAQSSWDLDDCGSFMLNAGAAGHAVAIIDTED